MSQLTASTSWTLSVALSLLLLVPRAGLAEEAMAPEAKPFQRTELPSSLRLLDAAPEPAPAGASNHLARLLAVTGGAALTGTWAVATGLRLAKSACPPEERESDFGCLEEEALGLLGSVAVGVPLGTWLGGTLVGGRGTYLGALLGTMAGAKAGLGVSFLLALRTHRAYVVAFPLCAVIGAVIGYEISHVVNTPDSTDAAPTVQPLLAVSSRGATLGLGGSF